jgi:hypothetical protein
MVPTDSLCDMHSIGFGFKGLGRGQGGRMGQKGDRWARGWREVKKLGSNSKLMAYGMACHGGTSTCPVSLTLCFMPSCSCLYSTYLPLCELLLARCTVEYGYRYAMYLIRENMYCRGLEVYRVSYCDKISGGFKVSA